MTMITPSYLGETIEYSSLHACRSTLEDPTIYQDTSSDVDVAVEPERVDDMKDCLREAAAATGHHSVLRARYVNFSYVYWHPKGGFIRIDMETEVRWRVFPILTAKSVVTLRRKEGSFYIPHPRHESAILFTAAIWRGFLSERYRQQLAHLYAQVGNPEELKRTFRAAFGSVGRRLAECQERVLEQTPDRHLWAAARRSLLRHAFRDAPTRRAFFSYLSDDMRRFFERLRQPPGISLLYASNAHPGRNMDDFFERIKFLYPVEKATTHTFQVSPGAGAPVPRLGFRMRLRRLYALFKGGLFIRFYELQDDRDIRRVLQTHTRYLYASRTFIWAENARSQTCLGHVETGFMADLAPEPGERVSNDAIIRYISAVLERYRLPPERGPKKRGAFVVLLGLDGSGKTTVARRLCCLGVEETRFRRIRYFHWQPRLIRNANFPLPEAGNLPRKPEQQRSLLNSVLSAARLLKNLLLARLAHALRVRPLLWRNSLVLVDRYFYNYFIDPVSVKYYGPSWLLRWVCRWFPRPDLVVVLRAPPEVLLARKQELSREEILRQSAVLDHLKFAAGETLVVDASRPATEIARAIWDKAAAIADHPAGKQA